MNRNDTFSLTTKRLVIGHMTVCQGCCCGNTANGRPPVFVDWLKKEWRARGLRKRVQLTISGCLGPCDLPNLVTVSDESGTLWLGGITEFNQYRALVDWAARSRDAGELLALPKDFHRHTLHPFRKLDSSAGACSVLYQWRRSLHKATNVMTWECARFAIRILAGELIVLYRLR